MAGLMMCPIYRKKMLRIWAAAAGAVPAPAHNTDYFISHTFCTVSVNSNTRSGITAVLLASHCVCTEGWDGVMPLAVSRTALKTAWFSPGLLLTDCNFIFYQSCPPPLPEDHCSPDVLNSSFTPGAAFFCIRLLLPLDWGFVQPEIGCESHVGHPQTLTSAFTAAYCSERH